MKAVILAAGYATRLYPLTKDKPKALLPIQGRPMIDYIIDEINTVPAVDKIFVVTNHKFSAHFANWALEHKGKTPIFVLDDGTTTEENRRGAIGDIAFAVEQGHIDDDLMVIAGDNYFTYRLADYYQFYQKVDGDCVCVKRIPDKEEIKRYGVALIDEKGQVLEIEEKPEHPKSDLAVYATYLYQKETVPMIASYLNEGNNKDAPGHFPEWLCKKKPVFAYEFQGECYDVGTPESYEEVCGFVSH